MSRSSKSTLKWRAKNLERYKKYQREYRKKNRARATAQQKKLREANRDRYRGYYLKKYGLTVQRFEQLKAEQAGRCAACRSVPDILHVDHCHETGVVRGLLCGLCNRALGLLKDDPLRIRALAAYAEQLRN